MDLHGCRFVCFTWRSTILTLYCEKLKIYTVIPRVTGKKMQRDIAKRPLNKWK